MRLIPVSLLAILAVAGPLAYAAMNNVAEIPVKDIDGKDTTLKRQKAKVPRLRCPKYHRQGLG